MVLSPDLQHRLNLMIGEIPQPIRKALAAGELEDRVIHATNLLAESESASSPATRKELGARAHRVLTARPRAETVQIVKAKLAKASAIGDPVQAASLEQQARDELDRHPPAPGRRSGPVIKASPEPADATAESPFLFHDPYGTPIAVCDPRSKDLTWLAEPGEVAARVTKAPAAGKARATTPATRHPGRR